jgi:signal transduction histidine kinase
MKIRTQLILSIILFVIALLLISASVFFTNQQVDRLNKQEELANSIQLGAGELGYLSNDYLLYPESQQLDRWNVKYASISEDLSKMSVDRPEQQVLLDNIWADQQRLKGVFDDVVSTIGSTDQTKNIGVNPAYVQLSWSRIAVQTRGMVFDTTRLLQMLNDEENQAKQTNSLLIFAMMGAFIAFLFIDYLLIYGRTIRSIANLQAGTRIIGSGNLDYSLQTGKRDDEISDLANSFNQMIVRLKAVTASKADLEGEILRRKQTEKALQEKQEKLEVQSEELSSNNEELIKQIEERKRAEEELADARAQAELYLDLMGHDINNMNQVGMGYLEIALETLNEEGRIEKKDLDLLEKPLQSIQDSTRLIENVRKLRSTKSKDHQLQSIDLKEALLGVKEQFSNANDRQVVINYTPVESHVLATGLVKDVFVNLVGNAIKHSDVDRPLEVNITQLHIYGTDESYHKVIIEDNGPGIPDELKTRIFNRFERGNTKAKGKGLGLYLVKTLVHDFNGKIWVEDRVQGDHTKGARFVVLLPSVGQ